jgi:hypothetical protein
MARRPRLTFRRTPRLGVRAPGERPVDAAGALLEHPPVPGTAEALSTLRTRIRLSVDHRLRCRICRRPPHWRRCENGEHLEHLRREADRAFSRHTHPARRPHNRPHPS